MKQMKFKGFLITQKNDGSFKVVYDCKADKKIYGVDCKTFRDATDAAYNLADNHELGHEVTKRMCKRWGFVDVYGTVTVEDYERMYEDD